MTKEDISLVEKRIQSSLDALARIGVDCIILSIFYRQNILLRLMARFYLRLVYPWGFLRRKIRREAGICEKWCSEDEGNEFALALREFWGGLEKYPFEYKVLHAELVGRLNAYSQSFHSEKVE